MIYIIVIAIFIYTLYRLNVLDKKIKAIKNPESIAPTVSVTPVAAPIPTPPPMTPIVPVTQPVAATPTPANGSDAEFKLGSRVFTFVGVIAVLLGVGFFLRYAFENNLISQGARVSMGCLFGLILIGVGHYLRKKYTTYGLSLIGAGFGVFYLSIYAAYSFYQLIDPFSAFVYLTLLTAISVALSIWYDSKSLIGFSFAGAFIMPFLLPFSGDVNTLFIYLLIINAGALLVARHKVWPILTVGSLAGTSLIYVRWITGPYTEALFTPTIVYCTIIFLSYFTTSLLNFVYRDRDYEGIDAILLYATPITYFFINLFIVTGQDNIAIFAGTIGVFNLAAFFVIRFGFSGIGELKKFSEGIFLMSSVFIAAALGLHFGGSPLTIIWAMQAISMVSIGFLIRSKINTLAGVALSILVGLKAFVGGFILSYGSVAIFNGPSGTLFLVALMYAVIWIVFHLDMFKNETEAVHTKDEAQAGKYVGIVGLFGTIFMWINFQSYHFVPEYTLYLPLFWLIYAVAMSSLSFYIKDALPRFLSYLVVFLAFGVMMFGQWNLDPVTHPFIFNIRVLTALVFALVSGIIIKMMSMNREQLEEGENSLKIVFLSLANLAVLWAFTIEILNYFNQQLLVASDQAGISIENTKRVSLSIFWLVYALAGLAVGIFRRSIFARYFSIGLFALTILKIFLYDTANLSDVYRFISFIVLGIILLIVGFSYYKFKDRIAKFVNAGE